MYALGEAFDRRGDRGAQQQRLPLLRAAAEDFFDVGPEADVEHAVGFVEHDDFELVELQRAAADVVEHAARRADDDVGAAFELVDLAADRLAAVERHAGHPPAVGELFEFVAHLHGELARRHQHRARGVGRLSPPCCRAVRGSE